MHWLYIFPETKKTLKFEYTSTRAYYIYHTPGKEYAVAVSGFKWWATQSNVLTGS
jgi:hypothetical protein